MTKGGRSPPDFSRPGAGEKLHKEWNEILCVLPIAFSSEMCYNKLIKRKEDLKMTREEMLTNIIRKFGFEHQNTIHFAYMCETCRSEKSLQVAYLIFMEDEE